MTTQTKTTWRKVKLGEITTLITKGTTPTTIGGNFTEKGINFIKVESISEDGHFLVNKFDFIDKKTNQLLKRSVIKENDILYSIAGTIGRTALVTKQELPANTNQALAIIRSDFEKVYPKYLFYILSTRHQRVFANSLVAQSVQANINLKQVSEFEIDLPEITEQKRIAEVFAMLDDKIELNNKINRNLEQMAQAIFKEWFVKNQKSKSKNQKLGDLMVLRKEKFKKYEDWKNLKLLDLGRFPQKSLAITSYGKGEEIKTAGIKFKKGDILFGAVRPYFHKVVIAPFDGVTNSSVFVIIPKKDNYYALLVTILFSENTVNYASMSASGTKMPVIKWEDLCDMEISLPEEKVLNNFNKIVENFYKAIVKNAEENQKLAALRDLLLPKLMSGEIRV
jgi:type I restriction enzyme, S subunit